MTEEEQNERIKHFESIRRSAYYMEQMATEKEEPRRKQTRNEN